MSNGPKVTHILADGDNTSDHLATCVSLNIPSDIEFVEGKPLRPSRLRWDRADTLWYQDVVASHLSNITIPIDALLCTCNRFLSAAGTKSPLNEDPYL